MHGIKLGSLYIDTFACFAILWLVATCKVGSTYCFNSAPFALHVKSLQPARAMKKWRDVKNQDFLLVACRILLLLCSLHFFELPLPWAAAAALPPSRLFSVKSLLSISPQQRLHLIIDYFTSQVNDVRPAWLGCAFFPGVGRKWSIEGKETRLTRLHRCTILARVTKVAHWPCWLYFYARWRKCCRVGYGLLCKNNGCKNNGIISANNK